MEAAKSQNWAVEPQENKNIGGRARRKETTGKTKTYVGGDF
jgi:hypothetical protein